MNRAVHRRMGFVILMTLAALGQQARPAGPAHLHFGISGTVVNAIGGEPLAHVEVTIARADNRDELQQAASDEAGHFSFPNVRPGKYVMTGQRRGFAQQAYQQHEHFFTSVAVGAGLVSENLTFRLSPDASITGSVTDEHNEAVRAGRVMLFRSGLQNGSEGVSLVDQMALDNEGRYRFDHLQQGKYFVAVLARPWFSQYASQSDSGDLQDSSQPATNPDLDVAYPLTYYPAATDPGGAAAIIAGPGDRVVADVSVTAVPAVHARIVHVADAGNVMLFQSTFDGAKAPVFAESFQVTAGIVELSGIAPGRFILNLQSFGGESSRQDREVDLEGGEQIDAGARLNSLASITGTVRLEDSKTVPPQVFIRFVNTDSRESFGGPVSTQGEFELRHDLARPGNYEVSVVNAEGMAVKSLSATGAKVVGQTVSLTGGTSAKLQVLVSKRLGRIDGTVLRDGKPLSQCMVLLVPQDPEHNRPLFRRDQSDSDGTFTLANVVPGKYTLVAIQNGWDLEWAKPAVLQPYLKAGQLLQVDTPRTYQANVKVQ